jgi:hypothetical protein
MSDSVEATMRTDEYRRLHAACLAMAQQCNLPDLQARWLAMAKTWSNLANDTDFERRPSPSSRPRSVTSVVRQRSGTDALRVVSASAR